MSVYHINVQVNLACSLRILEVVIKKALLQVEMQERKICVIHQGKPNENVDKNAWILH